MPCQLPFPCLFVVFFVSSFGTLIGFGGGVFMVPIMVIAFKIKMPLAIGAVAVSLFPAALISSALNLREKLIDPMVALWLEIPTVLGAILGAYLTSLLPVQILEVIFGIFLCFMAVKMFRSESPSMGVEAGNPFVTKLNQLGPKLNRSKGADTYQVGMGAAGFFGMISGLVAGLFGVGGGFMKTPIMIRVFHMPPQIAIATALFMIVFTSFTASFTHFSLGHVQWDLAGPLAIGFASGALVGNLLKKRFSKRHTERMIAAGLFLAGISTLAHAIWT